jgi:hypothetical protein
MPGIVTQTELFNAYQSRFEQAASGLWYPRVAQVLPTVVAEEMKIVMLGQSKGFTPWPAGTEPTEQQLAQYKVDASLMDYHDGFPISLRTRNANPELWTSRAATAGREAAYSLQALVSAHIVANKIGLDGVSLINTSHKIGSQAAQTNSLTSSDVSVLNVGTPATPTTQEAIDIVLALWNFFKSFKGENGRVVNAGIRELVIVVNTGDHFNAFINAVTQTILSSGATNTLAAIIASGNLKVEVFYDASMTGSNKIRVFNGEDGNRAICLGMDGPEDVSIMDEGSEYARTKNALKFGLKATMGCASGWFANVLEATLS